MTTPPDPADELLRALAAENRELRELLEAVAQELERMAAAGEMDTRGLLARAQHLAQATGLWLAGYSKREACRQTGVPRTTLSVSLDKAGLTERDRAKYTDIVEDLAIRAAEEAGRQLLERLEGDAALTPMQLATVFGICSDKLTAVRRLKTVPDTADVGLARFAERLARLSQGSPIIQVEPVRVIEAETGTKG